MRRFIVGAAVVAAAAGLTAASVGPVDAAVPRAAVRGSHAAATARALATKAPVTKYLVCVGATGTGQNFGLYRAVPGTTKRAVILAPGGARGVSDPPAIDPTGTRIAYAFADATGSGIAITSLTGTGTIVIVHRPASEPLVVAPTWSADGRTLVVERYSASTSVAVGFQTLKPVTGAKLSATIKGTAGLTYPKFLPRSSTVVAARRPKDGATVVVTLAGRLTVVGKFNADSFAISPNGKLLAYSDGKGGLWLRPWRAKGAARRLAKRGLVEFPAFSRDGATVFFDSPAAGGPSDIFSVNVAGKPAVREYVTPTIDEWGVAVAG